MVNARRCLVAVLARGTNSWPVAEEQRARHPGRPNTYRAHKGNLGHYQESTAIPKQLSYKKCAEQLGANAACRSYKLKQKYISVCVQKTVGTAKTQSRRAIRTGGKLTRIEQQWSSLLVTQAWTRAAAALRDKGREITCNWRS